MGYRSEVMIAITADDFNNHADQTIRDHLKDCDEVFKNEMELPDKDGYPKMKVVLYFHFFSVKWCADYEKVKCIEKFVNFCDNNAALLLIGEDSDDVTSIGDTFLFNLEVTRYISHPTGETVDPIIFKCNSIRYIVEEYKE